MKVDSQKLVTFAQKWLELSWNYVTQTEVWVQLLAIVVLYGISVLLSRLVEPLLEQRARQISGMPGLLRVIVAFLRRFEWLFFIIFLGTAYSLSTKFGWPGDSSLIYAVGLLSGAWLFIAVFSRMIRSRTTRKLFASVAWLYVAAMILGIVDDAAALLERASISVGSNQINTLDILQFVFVVSVTLWLAFKLGNFFERRIQAVDELTPSLRVLLGKITRIALIVFAGLITVSGLGIDLTAITVLSGAVGVGIGFGLQKVVSNFISGIIILLDQSIKPGDTISLGETFGWIRELRARFVSVVTRDGREFLIPNEDFITHEVINWSFSDKDVRLDVDFGVAYTSDPDTVTELAIEAAKSVERVNSVTKQPVCWMTEFGDSSLNFKLRFWIADPQMGLTNIRGQVLRAMWYAFKENGVDIPFPHREIIFQNSLKTEAIKP